MRQGLALLAASAAIITVIITAQAMTTQPSSRAEALFCPEDNCAEQIIKLVDQAQESVLVAVYSFTLDELGDALVRASERGVSVQVILEKDQLSEYSEYEKLLNAGISTITDSNPALMHHKFAVIDQKTVITGSFNWSRNANERNNENLLIVHDKEIAQKYAHEFWETYHAQN